MKIAYDADVDALSIVFHETTVTTKHMSEGVAVDYDADDNLAAIEVLDATAHFVGRKCLEQVILEDVGSPV